MSWESTITITTYLKKCWDFDFRFLRLLDLFGEIELSLLIHLILIMSELTKCALHIDYIFKQTWIKRRDSDRRIAYICSRYFLGSLLLSLLGPLAVAAAVGSALLLYCLVIQNSRSVWLCCLVLPASNLLCVSKTAWSSPHNIPGWVLKRIQPLTAEQVQSVSWMDNLNVKWFEIHLTTCSGTTLNEVLNVQVGWKVQRNATLFS